VDQYDIRLSGHVLLLVDVWVTPRSLVVAPALRTR
jgi:hypothetical protein